MLTAPNRTGIITKPDTLVPGSSSEAFYASLARNEEVEFRLGWHVLKNMDTEQGVATLKKRDHEEKKFFATGIWQQLPNDLLGISKLNSRLSKVLLNQIAQELPNVINEISSKLKHCNEQLEKLGQPRTTLNEQRLYLVQISQAFQTLVKAAVDGTYNDVFFGDPETEKGYQQRIRAVIQNLNRDFAKKITECGHYRHVISSTTFVALPGGINAISRAEFVDHIQKLMLRTRGRELPCTFSPMIVTSLFLEQCRPWGNILQAHVQNVWNATTEFLALILDHISDGNARVRLLADIVEPAMTDLLDALNNKAKELLQPHEKGHPITYNQQFMEAMQKSHERKRAEVIAALMNTFRLTEAQCQSLTSSVHLSGSYCIGGLVNTLAKYTEPDIDRAAASEALDCMEAYYKVSRRSILTDSTPSLRLLPKALVYQSRSTDPASI